MLRIHIKQNKLLINKHKDVGLKNYNNPKAFPENSNNMDDTSENIEEYNLNKELKTLIVFD